MQRLFGVLCLLAALSLSLSQREPGAKWVESPNSGSRNGKTPKWLIIHGTAGGASAENIAAGFKDPKAQVSAHYVVGRDGTVVQTVDEKNAAWANGRIEAGADSWWTSAVNPNHVTISIEIVKPKTDNSDTMSDAQKNAVFKLAKNIISRNPGILKGWANASGGITGHYSISPQSRKNCPGPFPFEELFASLK